MESDKRSVDDDISAAEASNGRTRKSEEDAGDSGDHGRAKKKLRSMSLICNWGKRALDVPLLVGTLTRIPFLCFIHTL